MQIKSFMILVCRLVNGNYQAKDTLSKILMIRLLQM